MNFKIFIKHKTTNRKGEILRENWNNQAEIKWFDDETIEMCDIENLIQIEQINENTINDVLKNYPHLKTLTLTRDGWRVNRPPGYKPKLLDKIKNAWSVLIDRSFTIMWNQGDEK